MSKQSNACVRACVRASVRTARNSEHDEVHKVGDIFLRIRTYYEYDVLDRTFIGLVNAYLAGERNGPCSA